MAYLTPTSGALLGKRIELKNDATTIGRHPTCDVVLADAAVSRQHARIRRDADGEFRLEDLNSRNGTLLNGQRIQGAAELQDGDLITVCNSEFIFHSSDAEAERDRANFERHLSEGSSFSVVLIDGGPSPVPPSARSKLDVGESSPGTQLTSSSEARLHGILSIARNLAGAFKLDDVLPKLLDTLFDIFPQADRAFIVLQEGDQLVPKWGKSRRDEPTEELRISRTVIREVMESKEAIISLDAAADSRFDAAVSVADFKIRSILVAPLLDSQSNPLGVLQLDTLDRKRRFAHEDLEVLAGIATQAGIVIENARLHEQVVQQQRVEQDLRLARTVQEAFLPKEYPQIEAWAFYSIYRPAEQIGGDYYDFIPLSDGRLAVVVADVAGHGVSAALLMAKVSAEVRFLLASYPEPDQAVTELNKRIAKLGVEKFVTLVCIVIDPRTGVCRLVNAAHMLPIWIHADRRITEPGEEQSGIPLGIMEDWRYESFQLQLEVGDRLVLYTDGINEASNPAGELYRSERLKEEIAAYRGSLEGLGKYIMDSVDKFCGTAPQGDDMCLVLIERSNTATPDRDLNATPPS